MIKKDDLLVLSRKDDLSLKSPSNLAFMPYFFVQTNFPYTRKSRDVNLCGKMEI